MKWLLRSALIVAIVAVMASIFAFSAETQIESTATSDVLANPLIDLFYPDFENLTEAQQADIILEFNATVRTLAHYTEYLVLGALAVAFVMTFDIKFDYATLFCALGFSYLYAISDEIHQSFVPGRSCEFGDIVIDTLGALVGILCMFTIVKLILKRYEKVKANS